MDFTWNMAKAAGKHVASYVAGGVSVAVAWHFLSPAQGTDITTNINNITSGLEQAAKGFAGLMSAATLAYTSWKAAHNASPVAKAASLEAEVPGTKIITAPEIAAAIPSPNVISNTDAKVVAK